MTTSLTDYAAIGQAVAARASSAAQKEAHNCTEQFTRSNKDFLGSIDPGDAKRFMELKFQSSHSSAYGRNIRIATGESKDSVGIMWKMCAAGMLLWALSVSGFFNSGATGQQTAQASGVSSSSVISK